MEERILIVPNQSKLSLSLAYQNKNLFNTRIFTPVELAREAMLRSGKICNKEFISRNDELSYYKELIDSVSYFKTSKLADIKSVNQTINTIRKLVVKDEATEIKNNLSKGPFKEKNDALYEIYDKYINKLNSENKIDTIGLIRYAIENAETIKDSEFEVLNEYPLQPLEEALINKVSNNVTKKSIFDLFEVKKNGVHIESYKNCYGSSNEVGQIIDDIFTNKKMDQCVVACADYPTYSQIFYDYACKYDIPVTFGNGISIVNSYPGKLLQQYYHWSSEGGFGWEPFFSMIHSPYFNYELLDSLVITNNEKEFNRPKFYERLSRLRLTNNETINKQRIDDFKKSISRAEVNDNDKLEKYVPGFEAIAKELALPIEEFLDKYFTARNDNEMVIKLDEAAKKSIINEIKSIKNMGLDITDDVIETLLRKPTYRQGNKPGHIHITTIDDALSSLRNNLYVCGLSSSVYPGSPKENPLLLDEDLKGFNNDELTSNGKIKTKIDSLMTLVKFATSLNNTIDLSYAGLNVSELKNNNASSLLFEIYQLENNGKSLDDFKANLTNIEYFEPKLSSSREIGKAYTDSKKIAYKAKASSKTQKESLDIGKYSPSALNNFFNCRKQFLYQNLLKLDAPDDYNPYEVIPATEQGTLVHALMEYLADHRMPKDDFIKFADEVFDEYMKITVPLIPEKIADVKDQFLDMVANGWQMDEDNKRDLDFKEEDKDCPHKETGIVIHGYPDRVETTKDGKAVIIDFKTERNKKAHKKDDIDSCLQVLIYAYIVENALHKEVSHCEYRMLRFKDGIVTCKYDEEMKNALTAKLQEFKTALDAGDFSIGPMSKEEEKEKCKYCKYGSICGKEVVEDE